MVKVMAVNFADDIEEVTPRRWRALIRQNSERIGNLAEEVVLPLNERTLHRMNSFGGIALRDVESNEVYHDTTTVQTSIEQPKYFPVMMISISVLQVIMFCKYSTSNGMLVFGYDPHRRNEIWRFFTIMLVHTRLSHLFTNVLIQLTLGVLLEIVHKYTRIAIIYFASIVGGSLFITLFSPNNYAVGASAGAYGLLFSHLSTIILNWKQMDRIACRLLGLLLYIIVDITINMNLAPFHADTNYVGHLGGAIIGFLVSILVLKSLESPQWKINLQYICFGVLMSFVIITIFINIFVKEMYLPTEWHTSYQNTSDDFFFRQAVASTEGSAMREYCKQFTKCKLLLNHYVGPHNN